MIQNPNLINLITGYLVFYVQGMAENMGPHRHNGCYLMIPSKFPSWKITKFPCQKHIVTREVFHPVLQIVGPITDNPWPIKHTNQRTLIHEYLNVWCANGWQKEGPKFNSWAWSNGCHLITIWFLKATHLQLWPTKYQ